MAGRHGPGVGEGEGGAYVGDAYDDDVDRRVDSRPCPSPLPRCLALAPTPTPTPVPAVVVAVAATTRDEDFRG